MKLGEFKFAVAVIAILTLAGCGEPPVSSRSVEIDDLQARTGRIKVKEQECALGAMKRSDDAIAQLVNKPDSSLDTRLQVIVDQRTRELAKCESEADSANDQITESERSEYQNETQEQRQRVAAMIVKQP